ncbi:ABC transporter permease [Paenibacillus sp. UNC451MF]|uniref:ABC transporter permease n=1 Tax=Paenibacillus sp. UNC451MF TaxID=1449063 RepID=UPI00048C3A8E|nr:ABC transporter permease [Paenibacillus sp. UNC451MF]
MLHKGLWFQNYKQSKYILWALWVVAIISGFQFYDHASNVAGNVQYYLEQGKNTFQYYFGADLETISALQLILCVGLAAFFVGFGRTNQTLELTYAMPVKREHIYLSKWLLGLIHIFGASTLGLIVQLAVVHTTILSSYLPDNLIWMYYVHQLFILCAVFSFSLWIGFIGGSVFSQVILCIIIPLVPYGLYGLIKEAVSLHYFALGITEIRENWLFRQATSAWFEQLSFPIKLINIREIFRLAESQQGISKEQLEQIRQLYFGVKALIVPLIVTAGSLWGMIRMAGRSRNENNGKLLLNDRFRPYLIAGIIVCAFLFGGALLENMLGTHYYGKEGEYSHRYVNNLIIFYVSGAISVVIVYGIIRKWLWGRVTLTKSRGSAG